MEGNRVGIFSPGRGTGMTLYATYEAFRMAHAYLAQMRKTEPIIYTNSEYLSSVLRRTYKNKIKVKLIKVPSGEFDSGYKIELDTLF